MTTNMSPAARVLCPKGTGSTGRTRTAGFLRFWRQVAKAGGLTSESWLTPARCPDKGEALQNPSNTGQAGATGKEWYVLKLKLNGN